MIIYTDGAYSPTRDQGGWAFFVVEEQLPVTAGIQHTTNNRMELEAINQALEYCIRSKVKESISIYTDSMYAVGVLTKNWTRNKNHDLLEEIDEKLNTLKDASINVNILHVKGHDGEESNEFVDKLANHSSQAICSFLAKKSCNITPQVKFNPYKDREIIL